MLFGFGSGPVALKSALRGLRTEHGCSLIVKQKGLSQSHSAFRSSVSVNSHIISVAWFLELEGGVRRDQEEQQAGFYKTICYGKLFFLQWLWVIC